MKSKRKFTPEFKSKVALEVLKERECVTEMLPLFFREARLSPQL